MKRLMLIAVLTTAYFMTGLFTPVFAQRTSIPVVTDSVFFYADSFSTTILLEKNEFLGQIWIDAGRTAEIVPQLYDSQKDQWSFLDDDGSQYTITIPDSSVNYVIPLKPIKFYLAKQIRFFIDNDPADTLSMRYDKRPY